MNKKFLTFVSCCVIGTVLQAGGYLYLDQVLFAPLSSSDYGVSDVKDKNTEALDKAGRKIFSKITVKGKAYYSHDYHYMADVTADSVTIYNSDSLNAPQKVDLKGQGVSFFEWDVTLARYNPEGTTHESDAPIKDLPRNAKIVDVAYSTATNAVYMKMEVGNRLYRIYRTDANYDTRRIYVQTSHIGKIAVFYDEDKFFYDDSQRGIMYLFDGDDSGWRVISPPGQFRLVGLGEDKTIYAVKVNSKDEVIGYYTGRLKVGFHEVKALETPVELNSVTVHMIREAAAANPEQPAEKKN